MHPVEVWMLKGQLQVVLSISILNTQDKPETNMKHAAIIFQYI
jgi:hypothetical protein